MRVLKFLLIKEFLQIFRNKVTLGLIISMPIFQLFILPWSLTFEQKDIYFTIVDNDQSAASRQLINKFTSVDIFHLYTDYSSYDQAIKDMNDGKTDMILVIPSYFEKNIINGTFPELFLTIDGINGQKGNIIASYYSLIIQEFNKEILKDPSVFKGINIKPYYRYNVYMKYQNYMVPGILVVLMSLIGGMLSAINIVREKEIGTIEQINVTPVPKAIFVLAKLIPFWIIGMLILTIGIIISWAVYHLSPLQNIFNIYLFAFIYMVAFSGFGLIISNYTNSQQQSIFSIFFFIMIFILLSGLFTPISAMPDWAQKITLFNPLRYFIESIRMLYLKQSNFLDIWPNLFRIILFAIVLNSWAIISYKKIK